MYTLMMNTFLSSSGAYHDEPLPKELVDMIVKELKLKEFMIK